MLTAVTLTIVKFSKLLSNFQCIKPLPDPLSFSSPRFLSPFLFNDKNTHLLSSYQAIQSIFKHKATHAPHPLILSLSHFIPYLCLPA